MSALVRVCDEPGCGVLLERGQRCETHRSPATPRKRSRADRIRSGAVWQRKRREILQRDGHQCSWGLWRGDRGTQTYPRGRCPVTDGLDVHHVTPIEDGGEPYDDANLRTLCRQHHERAERERSRARG